jgi:hypothetical protein
LEQGRLADEDEVVGMRKILAEQAQFAQAVSGHEMSVVDNGHEHFAGAMDAKGFLHEQALTVIVASFELDLEGGAKDAQSVVVGVQGAIDHGRNHAFWILLNEGLFEDAFAGARFAQDQAQAALLSVHPQDVEHLLLVVQQKERFRVERLAHQAEVRADHGWLSLGLGLGLPLEGLRSLAMGSSGRASPMRWPL